MFLVLLEILLIASVFYASIDYVFNNKITYTISDYIENIYNKLFNKKIDSDQISDTDKENTKSFIRPKFFGEEEHLPIQLIQGNLSTTTPSFNVQIPFNTDVNILIMAGLDNCLWIVDSDYAFELNICNQKIDISDICTINAATRTLIFFIDDNKFILNVNFDSGKTFIKTNSKEFESEFAILTFRAKHIETPKNFYSKTTLESSIKAKKILEEFENNKIGDNNV